MNRLTHFWCHAQDLSIWCGVPASITLEASTSRNAWNPNWANSGVGSASSLKGAAPRIASTPSRHHNGFTLFIKCAAQKEARVRSVCPHMDSSELVGFATQILLTPYVALADLPNIDPDLPADTPPQLRRTMSTHMKIRSLHVLCFLALASLLAAGCGQNPASQHLVSARETTSSSSTSPSGHESSRSTTTKSRSLTPTPSLPTTKAASEISSPASAAFLRSVISQDGTDVFALNSSRHTVTVSAPTSNKSWNTRQVFWRADARTSVDESSCAVWGNESSPHNQPAVALRIAASGNGVRAITVAKNIWFDATWNINIYLWDTSVVGSSSPLHQELVSGRGFPIAGLLSSKKLGDIVGGIEPFPWEMCAKVIGDQLTFRVWPLSVPDPGWGNPRFGGTVTLPADWVYAGQVGGYIAHLKPGDHVTFTSHEL